MAYYQLISETPYPVIARHSSNQSFASEHSRKLRPLKKGQPINTLKRMKERAAKAVALG